MRHHPLEAAHATTQTGPHGGGVLIIGLDDHEVGTGRQGPIGRQDQESEDGDEEEDGGSKQRFRRSGTEPPPPKVGEGGEDDQPPAPSFFTASRKVFTSSEGFLRPASFSPCRFTQITGTFIFSKGATSVS